MVQVYRKKYVIYIERVQREKANGTTVHVGIHPSKVWAVKGALQGTGRPCWQMKKLLFAWVELCYCLMDGLRLFGVCIDNKQRDFKSHANREVMFGSRGFLRLIYWSCCKLGCSNSTFWKRFELLKHG